MSADTLIAYATALAALAGLAVWGLRKYKQLNADGVITAAEILGAVEEVKEEVAETQEEVKEALKDV
jgi:hypothetical protein